MCGVKRGEAGEGGGKSRYDNGPGTKRVGSEMRAKFCSGKKPERKIPAHEIFVLLGCYAA